MNSHVPRRRGHRPGPRSQLAVAGMVAVSSLIGLAAAQATGPAATEFSNPGLSQQVNPVTALTADTFASPPIDDWPLARYNYPATATVAGLQGELEQMHEDGVGGVEVGQGSNVTLPQLTGLLRKANELDMTVGVKSNSGEPMYTNAGDYVRKTLGQTRTFVDAGATFDGAVGGTGTIVAVLAYRCSAAECETTGRTTLDPDSVVDLTEQMTGTNTDGYFGGTTAGSLNWTAPASPAGAQWALITFRTTQVAAQQEVFSREGTDLLIEGYEEYWTPEVKQLFKASRRHHEIFVDSHSTDPWGAPTDLWSSNMAADFESETGYSIVPELPALFYAQYAYDDASDERIRDDFHRVRTDLFIENRLKPFQEWAQGYNLALRIQDEDISPAPHPEESAVAAVVARPEHESLAAREQIDPYRLMASATNMTGNPWLSTECCAVTQSGYMETEQSMLVRMHKSYAGGINRMVYHVYPYKDGEASGNTWPGYSNFTGNSWAGNYGRRNPIYTHLGEWSNDYMARNSQVMMQGQAKVDVAIYHNKFESTSPLTNGTDGTQWKRYWEDLGLQRAGYSYDYLSPALLDLPNARVSDNKLAVNGPDYDVLMINTGLKPQRHADSRSMPVATARKILRFAKAGLPVVVVGKAPDRAFGKGDDTALRSVIDELLTEPSVHEITSEAKAPALLRELQIRPAADPGSDSSLMTYRRQDSATGTQYFTFYNQGIEDMSTPPSVYSTMYEDEETCRQAPAQTLTKCRWPGSTFEGTVSLEGTGYPFLLDATSGEITPIAEYDVKDGRTLIDVHLVKDDTAIIALAHDPGRFGDAVAPKVHVRGTEADQATWDGTNLQVRASAAGSYETRLSDGSTVAVDVPAAPAPVDLTDATWQLEAEDWTPTAPYGTVGAAGAETTKTPVSLTLADGLKAWPDIPQLEWASGIGTYTTTLDLPQDWTPGNGAVISLGQVTDTVTLKVNGKQVPVNQLAATADLGGLLHAGANDLKVTVATTLQNRLAQLNPATFYNTRGVQENGLVGPVVLTPYSVATVEHKPAPTDAPINVTGPSVVGTMRVDTVASCAPGTWQDATSFNYRWLRNGVAIPGRSQQTLTLSPAYLGTNIACEVRAANAVGATTEASQERKVARGTALVTTRKPVIRGVARVGRSLTATPGTWSPAATKVTYTWKIAGRKVATGKRVKLRPVHRGKVLTLVVTASRNGHAPGKATVKVRVRR
ncbi:hypothetical protein FXB39_08185 [Nocardioides sp. BGMRC 2183]|nr:hypothetical protein FXB39_08185 [Nocardioides sp. BGMRC 2183]